MSNPPPARSWFRLPNLGRQAQPKPPSPQQPRPPVLRPAFAQSFRPTQPQPRPPQPPPPPPTTTTTPQPPSPSQQQPRPPVLRPAFAQSFRPTQQPQPQPRPPQPPAPPPTPTTPQPPSPSPQQPRPPVLRPAFAQSFRPTQPQPQPRSPQPPPITITTTPQPPSPSPPPPRPVAVPFPPVVTSQLPRVVSSPTPPMTSPKTVNTASSEETQQPPPPPSSLNSMINTFPPKSSSYPAIESPGATKPLPKTSPPPPISLPLKGEPKKVLVQAAFNKQAIVPSYSSRYGNVKEVDRRTLSSFSEDGRNMKILTIGGENKGADMELGFFSRRSRGGKQTEFNGNGNVGNEAQESEDVYKGMAKSSRLPMNAFVNSNIQSVNSSILLDCSVTEHDPGVHFYISKKPAKEIGKSNGNEIGLKNNENRSPSLGMKE